MQQNVTIKATEDEALNKIVKKTTDAKLLFFYRCLCFNVVRQYLKS